MYVCVHVRMRVRSRVCLWCGVVWCVEWGLKKRGAKIHKSGWRELKFGVGGTFFVFFICLILQSYLDDADLLQFQLVCNSYITKPPAPRWSFVTYEWCLEIIIFDCCLQNPSCFSKYIQICRRIK